MTQETIQLSGDDGEMESPTECESCHETFDAALNFTTKPYAVTCPHCEAVYRPSLHEKE